MKAADHTKDSDCTIDPQTLLCAGCGVDHSSACPECGATGFHKEECSVLRKASPVVCDEDICDECDHLISRHGKDGCEVERGDGYRRSRTILEALGPCGCTAVTFEPAEVEGAA